MALRTVPALLTAGSLWLCAAACDRAPAPPLAAAPAAGEGVSQVIRFADPETRAASMPDRPVGTIGTETRPVLRAPARATLSYTPALAVPDDGRVTLRARLPESLGTESALLAIHVRPGDRWFDLAGRLVRARDVDGRKRVEVDFDLEEAAGARAGVWVEALAPVVGGEADHESRAVTVPERARIDLAIGVLEAGWGQGPVDFAISACRPGDSASCEIVFRERLDPGARDARGWRERSIDLASLAGQTRSFRFEARPVEAERGGSLPVWGDPILYAASGAAEASGDGAQRNLILLSLDTLRADHMGAYGYPRETTPFLDEAFAAGGTLFERYVAAASSTRPSHMTMFTSLPPSVHGATENTGVRSLPARAVTLAELLRHEGFATGAVTENGALDRSRGFGRGFGFYKENRGSQSAAQRIGHIEDTFEQGLAWLEGARGKRFFLFLHTYQVHNPFTPPAEYDRFFTEAAPDLEPPADTRPDWNPLLYDREIRYTDDRVRALFEALQAGGLLEDTLFVVTSDHGEAFGEHDYVAHGASLHEEVLHVPLLLRGPAVPAGLRIPEPVAMIDLMPTVLDWLEVTGSGQEMGRSLLPLLRENEREPGSVPRPIYSGAWATRGFLTRGFRDLEAPGHAVRIGARKLLRTKQEGRLYFEYYDLESDPGEARNLHAERRNETADLKALLRDYEKVTQALRDRLGEEPTTTEPFLDPVLADELRALGYLD